MRSSALLPIAVGIGLLVAAAVSSVPSAQSRATASQPVAATVGSPAPQTFKNLQIAVAGIERAPTAGLNDCPPGGNTVKAMTKPGEQFAIVSLAFKVLPGYEPGPLKRPTVTDVDGKTYNTAVSFVDVGKVPEFTCTFPFRTAAGATLKSLQLESLTFDLTGVSPK